MQDLYLIGSLPWWMIVLTAAGIAALLIQQFFALRRRLGAGQSIFLVLLRSCVYALMIFFLLSPALVEKRVSKLRRPLTVLVDDSQSMTFPANARSAPEGKPAKSRLQLLQEKLTEGNDPIIQRLSRDYDLHLYRFGTGLEPIAPNSLAQLKAHDQGTRLLELVQQAVKEAGAQSGVVVFSDGIANGGNTSLETLGKSPVPVFTVGVGDTDGFTDVRVTDVRTPEFAFRGREFKLDLTVQASGMKGRSVPLYFNRGRGLVTSRTISIDADPFSQKITLAFTPKEIGTHNFSLSIPNQPGEQITANNHKDFKVDVQRDKIRVLTLSGSPAWNYRFLRMAMKQDP